MLGPRELLACEQRAPLFKAARDSSACVPRRRAESFCAQVFIMGRAASRPAFSWCGGPNDLRAREGRCAGRVGARQSPLHDVILISGPKGARQWGSRTLTPHSPDHHNDRALHARRRLSRRRGAALHCGHTIAIRERNKSIASARVRTWESQDNHQDGQLKLTLARHAHSQTCGFASGERSANSLAMPL